MDGDSDIQTVVHFPSNLVIRIWYMIYMVTIRIHCKELHKHIVHIHVRVTCWKRNQYSRTNVVDINILILTHPGNILFGYTLWSHDCLFYFWHVPNLKWMMITEWGRISCSRIQLVLCGWYALLYCRSAFISICFIWRCMSRCIKNYLEWLNELAYVNVKLLVRGLPNICYVIQTVCA